MDVRLTAILQRQDLRNSSRDVDKRVQLVERREDRLVVLKEVLLDSNLGEGEEDAEDRLVLKPQNVESVLLSKLSNLVRALQSVHVRGNLLGHGVDDVVEGPVEHLDEKGEFLQDPAVQVSGKSGGVQRNSPDCLPLSQPGGLLIPRCFAHALGIAVRVRMRQKAVGRV